MKKLTGKRLVAREAGRLGGVTFGALLLAIGYSWFLLPYNMAPGGVGGLSQIFKFYFGIPNGLSMIMINIPLFIIGFIFIGKAFGVKSIYGMLVSSVFTDLVNVKTLAGFGWMDLSQHTHLYQERVIHAYLG
ncbi:MAG: YitT family protein, partial [Candidatus Syntrophosphaera sp.]